MADQGTEGSLSPFLRRQRFKIIEPYLYGKILDVGCGTGTLSEKISPDDYLGVEVDHTSLEKAISQFPKHSFQSNLPEDKQQYDTVIALAVIEHVKNPDNFLAELKKQLKPEKTAKIIITTPHPSMDWVHNLGAAIGLFSKHANEEHEELLDRTKLKMVGSIANLQLVKYQRFLFGANQIAIYKQNF